NTVPITVPALRERGEDIYLLFRKFVSDFTEKYRVKPITLTPDAIQELVKFRFQGNIRQLKNIVEQISVLEYDRELDVSKLRHYLPREQSNLPALFNKETASDQPFSERDILYKVLFDMRRDVSDLKKLVFEMLAHQPHENDLLKEHSHLFENLGHHENRTFQQHKQDAHDNFFLPMKHHHEPEEEYEEEKVEDIPHETEEES